MSDTAPLSPLQSPNVTRLERDGRRFFIIGTAHVSARSVEEVRAVIAAVKPDTVCVELCQTRFDAMTDESRWRKLDIFQVLKQKKVLFLMSNLALSAFQRRLGERLGVKPGAELMAAVESSREANATLVLVDRDIQATLKRTWARLGFFRKLGLLNELLAGFFSKEELTEAELERMKDRDVLSDMLAEFARQAPEIKGPLIDERDLWLASSVYEAPGQTVVAVVGAGHVPGMVAHFGAPVDRAALAVIPPARPGLAGVAVARARRTRRAPGVRRDGTGGERAEPSGAPAGLDSADSGGLRRGHRGRTGAPAYGLGGVPLGAADDPAPRHRSGHGHGTARGVAASADGR